jgi:succinoglycan biosynthesis transport protein ExoP
LTQYDINLREYWRILKKRKLIVIFTAFLLGSFSTFFAIINAPTPLYSSTCSIKFEKETTLEGLYAQTLSWSDTDDIETQLSIVTGYEVLTEVAKRLGLIPQNGSIDDPGIYAIVDGLKSKVTVERENYTNIIDINVTDRSSAFAQKMANELAKTYRDLHAEQQGKRTKDALKYIDDQLTTVRQKLRKSEEEFNRFSQVNQLISIDLQSENLLIRKKEITDAIRKLNEDKSELTILLRRINKFLDNPSSTDTNFYSTRASAQYQATNNSLVELFLKKDTLLENYTEQHPDVKSISLKIIENTRKMVLLLKLQMDTIEQKKTDLNEELNAVDVKTNTLMEKKLEYDRLKREVDSFRNMTVLLENKNQEALIKKAEKPEEVVIVKPALQSNFPINPPKTLATGMMGITTGIVLGLILAFIIETFDTSIGAIEDVEETLGAKVLGVIPYTDMKDIISILKGKYTKELDESTISKIINLVSHFAPKAMISESFRALRTNIQFTEENEKIKTIAITSTSPQEGKTLVSVNLAISLAQAGLKTLLIGADLRKPMIGHVFGLEENPGLTDIILGSYPWTDTVKTVTDIIMGRMSMDDVIMTPGLDNLNIITSGPIPPNPAELLESKRLISFIEEAEKKYDIVIFDSTPVLSTADAAILGTKVDSVLIVYRVGAVSKGLLKRTSSQLKQVNCSIMGVILNGMKPDISPDFPSYKYYQYFSYYGDAEGESPQKTKKPFSFFPWKSGDIKASLNNVMPSDNLTPTPDKNMTQTSSYLKIVVAVLSFLILLSGILWQSGIINPFNYLISEGPVTKPDRTPETTDETIENQMEASTGSEPDTKQTPPEEVSVRDNKAVDSKPGLQMEENKVEEAIEIPPYPAGTFPYSIYLGSFNTREKAEKAISEFTLAGLSTFSVKVSLKDKGIWYRIYSGYFKEYKETEEFIKKHNLIDASIKNTTYTNLIEDYQGPNDIIKIEESLKIKGFSPYEIDDMNGNSYLLVGAFLTKEGAEAQNAELKVAGFNSQVIKR